MFAPRRISSLTCMKRFSKMVSWITALPSATQSSAMNWACMSVGKAGYSLVRKPTAFGRLLAVTRIQSAPASMPTPASRSLSMTAPRCSACALRRVTSPPAAPTAHRKVPASMRSGMIWWACAGVRPCRRSTPWMRMRLVPRPSIWAPMATSRSTRSVISGSLAAFSRMVSPSARAAAIRKFSVPVTVTMSVVMLAPLRRVGCPLASSGVLASM